MAAVTLSNIKKAFGDRELFQDASFFIGSRERVALIGANGTGKTTILRIICGEETEYVGSLTIEPRATVGYLSQDVDLPDSAPLHRAVVGVTPQLADTAAELANLEQQLHHSTGKEAQIIGNKYAEVSHRFDNLGGFNYQVQAKAILLGLGFDEEELNKPVQSLSGGQKTRAALARLLLLSPDVLLLDEPTNHLDIQATDWLQTFLQEKHQGAALIVSHDRYFLDRVVSKVVEIEDGILSTYPGNYSAFAGLKAEKTEEQRKLFQLQKKEIARLEAAIQTLFSHRKFSRRDSKVKELERVERLGRVKDQRTINARLSAGVRSGREVLRISGLAKGYPGKTLFSGLDLALLRGRKLGIVGPNGSGKTTLLKIIAERETADAGEITLGHKVQPVYFAQEFDHLDPNRSVIEELLADADIASKQARDLLAQFLFIADDAFKKVEVLSGGELCRLALAKVVANSPNLLLLDEPTNHLDIRSREALETALRAFNGTVLVASHDRYLLDAISDEILEIKDGGWGTFPGNYSNYREKTERKEESTSQNIVRQPIDPPKARPISPTREKERRLRDLNKQQRELEKDIEQMEARSGDLTIALGDEESYRNGSAKELSAEYEWLTRDLEAAYSRWEHICEQIAAIE